MKRNRGFSLVELLVATAILSVVMVIALSFMMTGSRSFTKGSADSTVQKEAELTVNQIEDMIIDLNGGVSMNDDASKTELSMYHAEDDGSGTTIYSKSAVRWDKSDKNVYCSKWDVSYDASTGAFSDGAAEYADQLLAEHVTDFKVDLSDTLTTKAMDGTTKTIVKSVLVSVGYDDGTGVVDYATSPVITLRNRMLLSDNPSNIFDENKPAADTMKLHYSGAETGGSVVPIVDRVSEVTRGAGYNIYAKISTNNPGDVNDLVDWVIEETGTLSTIDASGYLTVGAYEANAYLTITASYKSNPNKKATGVVKVVGGGALKSLKSVHIDPVSLKAFAPQYRAIPVTEGFTQAEEDAIIYKWTVSVEKKGEGDNKELSDVVEPFADNNKILALIIKKEQDNFGRMLEITVEAHSNLTGETRTDRIKYRIDKSDSVDGDPSMERGKLEYGSTNFKMSDVSAPNHKYSFYFCDEYGNEITAYEHLKSYIELVPKSWDTYRFSFKEGLPMNQSYYVKVLCEYWGSYNPMEPEKRWTCERIHYIPAVQIYGKTCYNKNINVYNPFTFEYTVVGYWENAWANSNPPVYVYDIVDFAYSAPDGVTVTPEIVQTVTQGDDKPIWARGEWRCSTDDSSLKSQIEFKSLTIRVSAKGEPGINALVTIIFE